jgi:integrase
VIDAQWTAHEQLAASGVLCPWVFHRDGKPIEAFLTAWATACAAVGVPAKIPHDFRRTAVRNLVRAGVPEQTAMKLTGHKTRSVFDRYDIVNKQDLHDAVGKLAGAGTKLAGTKQGQSRDDGRVAPFFGRRASSNP